MLIADADEATGGEPRVKLADFGVSTLLAGVDDTTEGGAVAGRGDGAEPGRRREAGERAGRAEATPGRASQSPEFETTREQVRLSAEDLSGETRTMSPPLTATRSGGADAATGEAGPSDDGGADGHLTQTGILVGTPMYMAPELREGSRDARPASDVFSLGVIAYEVLTGEVPFLRPPVWARFQGEIPPAPSLARKRPDVPVALHQLVDSCLSFDPALRPTAAAVVAQLAQIFGDAVPPTPSL